MAGFMGHWQVIIELSPAIQWITPPQWAQIYSHDGFHVAGPLGWNQI